jgi:hypothetical protein
VRGNEPPKHPRNTPETFKTPRNPDRVAEFPEWREYGSAIQGKEQTPMRSKSLAFLLCLAAFGCAAPTGQSADPGPYPANYQGIVTAYLKETLKDPDSIKDLTITTPVSKTLWTGLARQGNVNTWSVCVGYNVKNSYGGYVGKKYYAVPIKNGRVLADSEGKFVMPGC